MTGEPPPDQPDGTGDRRAFWEAVWSKEDNRGYWSQADPEVLKLLAVTSPSERPDVLDLGCGLGRHAIAFAQAGYHVTAVDVSAAAIAQVQARAQEMGLAIRIRLARFGENAFAPETFDLVLAVNVLYHGLPVEFARAVADVQGWLRRGGLFYFTCPTLADGEYGKGTEIAPHTFELEPGHVHFNAAWEDIEPLLAGYRVVSRGCREHHWEEDGARRLSCRWQVLVEKQ
jgi:SAM-dependent methyltransferase